MVGRYDEAFMGERVGDAHASAPVVIDLVVKALGRIESVIDVGCASGGWLREFADRGAEILGIDGEYARSSLVIPESAFVAHDLSRPLPTQPSRYKLAVCLEVAEHLPADRGPALVSELASLSDSVLFSAAIPGQTGEHHVNLRWQSYWMGLFQAQGYGAIDCVRPAVWTNPNVPWWYAQNALLYVRGVASASGMPIDVVHPGLARVAFVEPQLKAALGQARAAATRSIRFRVHALSGRRPSTR